jgi:uncharacterized protein
MMSTRLRRVLLRVVFYTTAVFVLLPMALCHVMTAALPRPATLEPPPRGYEEVRIESEGLRLRGWVARTDGQRAAVLIIHGLGDSIESYTPLASTLRERGHSVLLLDLRGHGGSAGSGTLGDREREDVRAGIEHLRTAGLAPSGVVLFGHSMGAVAVLRAAAGRGDVRAVVVEAPFDTLRETVAHHGELLYRLPRWLPIASTALAFAEISASFDADHVDAVAAARELKAPLLAIADGDDRRMPEAVVRRIVDAHPGPKRFWVVPGAGHLGAMADASYDRTIEGFLAENGL